MEVPVLLLVLALVAGNVACITIVIDPVNPFSPSARNPIEPDWSLLERSYSNDSSWKVNAATQVWDDTAATPKLCMYSKPTGSGTGVCRTNLEYITRGVGLTKKEILTKEVQYMLRFRLYDLCYKWTWVRFSRVCIAGAFIIGINDACQDTY